MSGQGVRTIEDATFRLRVLAEATHAFAAVVADYQQLLDKIVRTTATLVGDGALVTLVEGELLVSGACAHRDPAIETAYREYLARLGVGLATSATIAATVIRTGAPMLVGEIDPRTLVERADPELKQLVAMLDVRSFVVVPIRSRQVVTGSLSLFRSGAGGAAYTEDDLVMMMDLADRAGLAIENARLYADLERRVRERTAQLETSNRELEAFSYSVAHDLRAPLRTISGFSQLLLEDCGPQLDDIGRDYIARVRRAAGRMSQLIDDLLELARIARGDLLRASVDLTALAHVIVRRLRDNQPRDAVEVVIEDGITANVDPRLVEVALTNLLGNAWKFTRGRDPARIELGTVPGAARTTYFVRDNGVGFAAEDAHKLFVAFSRLHANFEGSGVGLATVQRVIDRHGGRIWVEAEVDRGATFYFTLEPGVS